MITQAKTLKMKKCSFPFFSATMFNGFKCRDAEVSSLCFFDQSFEDIPLSGCIMREMMEWSGQTWLKEASPAFTHKHLKI